MEETKYSIEHWEPRNVTLRVWEGTFVGVSSLLQTIRNQVRECISVFPVSELAKCHPWPVTLPLNLVSRSRVRCDESHVTRALPSWRNSATCPMRGHSCSHFGVLAKVSQMTPAQSGTAFLSEVYSYSQRMRFVRNPIFLKLHHWLKDKKICLIPSFNISVRGQQWDSWRLVVTGIPSVSMPGSTFQDHCSAPSCRSALPGWIPTNAIISSPPLLMSSYKPPSEP